MKGHLDVKELERYKKTDIQRLAHDLGVSDEGTIREIAARCAAMEIEVEEGELTQAEREAFQEEKEAAGQRAGNGTEDAPGEPQTGQKTAEEDKAEEITTNAEKAQEEAGKASGGVTVEVVARYLDKRLKQIKEAGEVFTVDRERAAVLARENVVKIRE